MIEMQEEDRVRFTNQSSKGNQLKFLKNNIWYKSDYTGYEGLAEYVVSEFLKRSTLDSTEYVTYRTEEINYAGTRFLGCSSNNFLEEGAQIITLERLYGNVTGDSLYKTVWGYSDVPAERLKFLVDAIEKITNIDNFGKYLAKMLTIDGLFYNEDRHFHNIAVLMNPPEKFSLCPFFDQGASLFADTRIDFPLDGYIYDFYDKVRAKTIASNFDDQMDAAEKLYGETIKFSVSSHDIEEIVDADTLYSENVKKRVKDVLYHQKSRYGYLFDT